MICILLLISLKSAAYNNVLAVPKIFNCLPSSASNAALIVVQLSF